VLTLALVNFGYTFRFVRTATAETMGSDYVRQARLNGIGERTVVWRYALRNALAPVIQISSLVFLSLVAGVVITETVFSYPGIGRLAVTAAISRDFTTMLGIATVIALMYVLINLVTDVVIIMANPKTRAEL
jgi:peptide/nickel transport system permease protein